MIACKQLQLSLLTSDPLIEYACLKLVRIIKLRHNSITIEVPPFKCVHSLSKVSVLFIVAVFD